MFHMGILAAVLEFLTLEESDHEQHHLHRWPCGRSLRRAGLLRTSLVAQKRLSALSKSLGDKPYLDGDRFTAGDLMMTTVLRILRHTDIVTSDKRLAAYVARCAAAHLPLRWSLNDTAVEVAPLNTGSSSRLLHKKRPNPRRKRHRCS